MPSEKNSYGRHGYGRHSSFRGREYSEAPGIPGAKWLLVMMILAVVVLGYDHLRGRGQSSATAAMGLLQQDSALPTLSAPELQPQPQESAAQSDAEAPAAEDAHEGAGQAEPETMVTYEMEKRPNGFVGEGAVNGKPVTLLADTGASHVVIPENIARRLGLKKGEPMQFSTAGGNVTHYATTLDRLTLGAIEVRDVNAVINPAMQNNFILLGMNVMGLLNMKMEGAKLVLQHPANQVASQDAGEEQAGETFRRSAKECASRGNKFDQQSLECLRGR